MNDNLHQAFQANFVGYYETQDVEFIANSKPRLVCNLNNLDRAIKLSAIRKSFTERDKSE